MTVEARQRRAPGLVKGTPMALNGDTVVAHAMRQVRPDVVACYPITPQTILTEVFSEFVANGEVHTEFVTVESEHAAMSACVGSAAAGARTQTATSGPGLALMFEVLWVASGMHLPIVLHLCTRAFSSPLSILGDHHDMMAMRETGWVILSAETAQEAYDNAIQAVRIAEHPKVLLPTVSAMDGFITTHSTERCEILPDDAVRDFVGEYKPAFSLLDLQKPITVGSWDFHEYYLEHKRQQVEAMNEAMDVVRAVSREYGEMSGRGYGLVEAYRMEDAEVAVIMMGSATGTVRTVVDELRADGVRAGVLRLRLLRPFPAEDVIAALSGVRAAAVLERSISYGAATNALHMEIATALASQGSPVRLESWCYGVGGRNTTPAQFRHVFEELSRSERAPAPLGLKYVDLRE